MRRIHRRERHINVPSATSRAGGGSQRLRCEVSEGPRSARMALYGEFDIDSADAATHALRELLARGLDAVVLDLRGLEFMDSTGVRFLVDARNRAHALGVKLSLIHAAGPVRRVLTVSGVTALFEDEKNGQSSP
jgi:anti-anti-sigma factor